jgi:6-phosphogluconolactonase
MKRWWWMAGIGLLALCGCGNFFTSQNSGTGGGTGGGTGNTSAGDVLYIANLAASNVLAYTVSSKGALAAVSGSPYTLSTASPPTALAVTPGNTFLYVGVAGGIVGYSIGTNGVLTQLSSGAVLASDVLAPASLQVDSTGGYLVAAGIDLGSGANTAEVDSFAINSSTGALTPALSAPMDINTGNTSTTSVPSQLYITPNNSFVYVTLGTGGTEALTFDATNGTFGDTGNLPLSKGGSSQNGVIANAASTLLFVSETGTGVRVLTIGTNAALTEIKGSPFAAGTGASGVVLDAAGTTLYVANKGDGTITGFSVAAAGTAGTLVKLASSPYAAGSLPLYLALDQSKEFLAVTNSGGSPDVGLYSFDATTPGKLDALAGITSTTPTGSFLVVSTH